MKMGGWLQSIVASAVLLLAAPANGQSEPERIAIGESVRSSLTDSLERLSGSPFRVFRFEAESGTVYRIAVTDVGFDPDVRIARTVAAVTDYLATARSQGMGAGALIEIAAPVPGDVMVVVRSEEGGTGEFTLAVSEVVAGDTRPLELNQPIPWSIGVDAAVSHPFTARAGEEIQITVRSREFDTFLEVGRIVDGAFVLMESDDDGAGNTDSRVHFTPTATGEYVARVTSYGGGLTGQYAILMDIPGELPEPRPLGFGERTSGRLSESDPLLDTGHPFNDWEIALSGGDRVAIELQSPDFDTYLSVGRAQGRRFVELASNDDWHGPGLGDTDSRVVLSVPEDGAYIVRVRSFGAGQQGAYTLLASALAPLRTDARGGELSPGGTVAGTIGEDDATLQDGHPYQEWRLAVATAGRYDIQVRSSDFDTYLVLGEDRSGFDEIAANDDWEGSENATDSRILVDLDPGAYLVRVRPFRDSGRGDYELAVREAASGHEEPAGGSIQTGQTITASLSEEDARLVDDDVPYQEWVLRAQAGEGFVIELVSLDFDSYLSVGRRIDGGFVELASNDDYGNRTDSRIDFVAPESGEYLIRARPLFDQSGGEYTLSITSAP